MAVPEDFTDGDERTLIASAAHALAGALFLKHKSQAQTSTPSREV